MARARLSGALLLWLVGGLILPVAQARLFTGSTLTPRPACCRNEATCPMHQHHAAPKGHTFETCSCDGESNVTSPSVVRAIFPATASLPLAVSETEAAERREVQLARIATTPPTPPPRAS